MKKAAIVKVWREKGVRMPGQSGRSAAVGGVCGCAGCVVWPEIANESVFDDFVEMAASFPARISPEERAECMIAALEAGAFYRL